MMEKILSLQRGSKPLCTCTDVVRDRRNPEGCRGAHRPGFPACRSTCQKCEQIYSGWGHGWKTDRYSYLDSVKCHHLCFIKPPDLDLALWVEANEQALPRRVFVKYCPFRGTQGSLPSYLIRTSWFSSPKPNASFRLPGAAAALSFTPRQRASTMAASTMRRVARGSSLAPLSVPRQRRRQRHLIIIRRRITHVLAVRPTHPLARDGGGVTIRKALRENCREPAYVESELLGSRIARPTVPWFDGLVWTG